MLTGTHPLPNKNSSVLLR